MNKFLRSLAIAIITAYGATAAVGEVFVENMADMQAWHYLLAVVPLWAAITWLIG